VGKYSIETHGRPAYKRFPEASVHSVHGLVQLPHRTTGAGGNSNYCHDGCGIVYRITAIGTLTTLYSFCAQGPCTDGAYPYAGLVQAGDGNFFGTTNQGGWSDSCTYNDGCGTVFKITRYF